ncbi:hypothetical protein BB560_001301 [Smittium megazygosporum]|uniref:AMP-dependent synthetase/ligase domain-containing protein n=1 Tax=Smittium megazygosporum TaxID=133381 RepID=A0A2T9ZI73_9FUNG|nr:hypothetical protein BB560_001301 [Smittium megazygosporum]
METFQSADNPMWVPKDIENQEIYKFMMYSSSRFNRDLSTYDKFHAWSVTELEEFWAAVWDYSKIITHTPYSRVLDKSKTMDQVPSWFEGATVNYAENIFNRFKDTDRVAIYVRGEQEHKNVTFRQLYLLVSKVANSLRKLGIKPGDRVSAFIPNNSEAIVGFLACASIGAIWSSAPVDFGVIAVTDRFKQIEPKVYITVDQSTYNGKTSSLVEKNLEILKSLSSVEHVVIIETNPSIQASKQIPSSITWDDFIRSSNYITDITYEIVPFNHPLFIVFTSGTTGKPKCITHSTGGFLCSAKKENQVVSGINETDIYFYYTTTGWIMWNVLLGVLVTGASIVTYHGNPLGPKIDVLWNMVDEIGVTCFGTSPRYLQTLEDNEYYPKDHYSLATLKTLTSTGSPLKPNNYEFIYKHIKSDVFLVSISGGTELGASFLGGVPILPVYKGEIQCILPAMAVECWDDSGNRIFGKSGDLVCTKPFPSMPVFFWGDTPEKTRYKSSYFERFPGIWFHGDYLQINKNTGGIIMLGRSDGTLNPNGVRFGSAEIYNVVEEFPEVLDSLVVGQQTSLSERVLLFILIRDSSINTEDLQQKINARVREKLSPRHVPAKTLVVEKIPYTANGKKVEIAVKLLLNKGFSMSQEYIAKHGKHVTKSQVSSHVKSNFTLDERTIQSVTDPSSIFQFLEFTDLFFEFDVGKSKL